MNNSQTEQTEMCAVITEIHCGLSAISCERHDFFVAVLSTAEPDRAQEVADAHNSEYYAIPVKTLGIAGQLKEMTSTELLDLVSEAVKELKSR